MGSVIGIISIIVVVNLLLVPLVLLALDVMFYVQEKEAPIFELIAFFTGSIYMILVLAAWELPDYRTPLNKYGMANVHEPFSKEHFIAIVLFALWGFFSYYILKFRRKSLPPLAEVLLLGGVYVGCGLSLVWIFQLLMGASPEGMGIGESDSFLSLCLCVVPVVFLIHAIHLMVRLVKEKAGKQAGINYDNPVIQRINLWFLKGANLFLGAVIGLLPVLGILVIILCLFGQQPDGIILAFTKTSDWILSAETAPPPVEYDTHYLCTVSLRGHAGLVRPLRYGIRRGEKIVVNRQLCVANAFEQLLMEKAPRFHKMVRSFYDTYGYPISRHINSPWSADIVYLIMKPPEWIFAAILYLFDEKPENRINSQYLPEISR
ncbi:MAG: hypothetical protein K2O16_05115 [Lachnospiraceae bacterium]|nr:hypothetical protein [Lachnospiraceae bacterium]